MKATAGELLTSDGAQKESGLFANPEDAARNKPLRVYSNDWAVWPQTVEGDKAEVTVGYSPIGEIDSKLRFKPESDDGPCMTKYGRSYHLALVPAYFVMYRSEGGKLTAAEKKPTGKLFWQITEPRDFNWTTVNTAIRYVLEKQKKSKDPVVQSNGDQTIKLLLQYH